MREFEQRVLGMDFHNESNYNEPGNERNNKISLYQHSQAEKEKHSTQAMFGHDGEAQYVQALSVRTNRQKLRPCNFKCYRKFLRS